MKVKVQKALLILGFVLCLQPGLAKAGGSVTPTKVKQQLKLIAEEILQQELNGRALYMLPLSFPVVLENKKSVLLNQLNVLSEEKWIESKPSMRTDERNRGENEVLTTIGTINFQLTDLGRNFYQSEKGFPYAYMNYISIVSVDLPTINGEETTTNVLFNWKIENPMEWIWAPAFDFYQPIISARKEPAPILKATALLAFNDGWYLKDIELEL